MTEAEWWECTDPQAMLEFLQGKSDDRKLRLFALACCRRIWHLLGDCDRTLVESRERHVEGSASGAELDEEQEQLKIAMEEYDGGLCRRGHLSDSVTRAVCMACSFPADGSSFWTPGDWHQVAVGAARHAAEAPRSWASEMSEDWLGRGLDCPENLAIVMDEARRVEKESQSLLLRCIFGDPFRPVAVDPAWLAWNDGTIPKLARVIYEERRLPWGELDLHLLAALAEVLEDAGCTDAVILGHCRAEGPHVRGCWVVDLLLGRG
jgi:hypothetical protein